MSNDSQTRFSEFSRTRADVQYGWRFVGVRQHFSVRKENQTVDTLSAHFRFVVEVDGVEKEHRLVLPNEICCTLDDLQQGRYPAIHNIGAELIKTGADAVKEAHNAVLGRTAEIIALPRQMAASQPAEKPHLQMNG